MAVYPYAARAPLLLQTRPSVVLRDGVNIFSSRPFSNEEGGALAPGWWSSKAQWGYCSDAQSINRLAPAG